MTTEPQRKHLKTCWCDFPRSDGLACHQLAVQPSRTCVGFKRVLCKATKEKRWGKVKALQRLLTHSFSGKALAVRRVTENNGKNTQE